jgi:uncharacterized membrane protein
MPRRLLRVIMPDDHARPVGPGRFRERRREPGAILGTEKPRKGAIMSKADGVFIFVGTYASEVDAKADYDTVKELHSEGAVGTFDAAVITKDDEGKVHVNKHETSTRHGAWGGAGVGALVGILFPPSIIASAIVGAGVGGVGGHLWKGMSRSDVKEFGDAIDAGEAALVVVGQTTMESYLEKAQLKAQKRVAKELELDKGKIDDVVKEAAKSLK